ncbi:hypothetical protein FGA82_30510 [Pseudomonas fluorescens]|nr:hypothetical protein FGA82_30510 [Pseudomonas fluorescens]
MKHRKQPLVDSESIAKTLVERPGFFVSEIWLFRFFLLSPPSCALHKSLWERACSRRRRHIQNLHRLAQRFREQARSHMGMPSYLCGLDALPRRIDFLIL